MKLLYSIFFICFFVSCTTSDKFMICKGLSDIISLKDKNPEKIIVFLQGENEKKDNLILCKIYDMFHSKYLCIEASGFLSITLKKILCYPQDNVFIVIENNCISSIVTYKDIDDFKMSIINSRCSLGNINDSFNLNTINYAFKKVVNKECLYIDDVNLDNYINKSYFYDVYLLAKSNESLGRYDLAEKIYSKLWNRSTRNEKKMYVEEFLDIAHKKDNLIRIDNECLIVNKKIIDFGDMKLNERKQEIIFVTNNSNKPFIIRNIQASCGCTVVSWNRKPIAPANTDSITIDFKAINLGLNLKNVTIIGNSKHRINVVLKSNVIK